MDSKGCTRCKQIKELNAYSKDSRAKSGLQSRCKQCFKEMNTSYYETNKDRLNASSSQYHKDNRDRIAANNKTWRKANPERMKAMRQRERDRPGYKEKQKRYREDNAERLKAYHKAYLELNREQFNARANHRRTLKRSNGGDAPYNFAEIILALYPLCLQCGSTEDLQVDHIVPLSKGGSHSLDNMQTLCETHNKSKGNRNSNDYRPRIN